MVAALPPEVAAEIAAAAPDPERPLIICDADEVLLVFMGALEVYLNDNDFVFDWSSFRLTGNVRRAGDDRVLDSDQVRDLLDDFYAAKTGSLAAVPGAAEALDRLAARASIVVLSNLPRPFRDARARNLAQRGMDFPLIVNAGPKGHAVHALAGGHTAPVVFIDDAPNHHASVAKHADHVRRLHFVHDARLAALVDPAPASHHRADVWHEAMKFIEAQLDAAGF